MSHSRRTIETQIEVRMRRQERLTTEEPLHYEAIIQESVLHWSDGDPDGRRSQLHQILDRASLPNVTIRVMPESAGRHDGLYGTFTLLTFPDVEDKDIAYVEHALGAEHIEIPEQVSAARLRLDHLARLALSPAESMEFIERVIAAL